MYSLQVKSGDCITIGDDVVIRVFQMSDPDFAFRMTIEAPDDVEVSQEDVSDCDRELSETEKTRALARQIVGNMPLPDRNSDLLGPFLSELVLQVLYAAKEGRKERQKRGIEAAKKRGVRFGKPKRPLPDRFDEARQAWRGGRLSLLEAAKLCGMPKSSFYNAVLRLEEQETEEENTTIHHNKPGAALSYTASGKMI